ncbi:hypothetical protein Droror1_Dr00012025 [Drosera rotundifolia]
MDNVLPNLVEDELYGGEMLRSGADHGTREELRDDYGTTRWRSEARWLVGATGVASPAPCAALEWMQSSTIRRSSQKAVKYTWDLGRSKLLL